MSFIEFQNVDRVYETSAANSMYAVKNVNFQIEQGEFVVILGQSGAGKSTVLNMLGGMDRPNGGKVLIDGENISTMNDSALSVFRANKIGFIFQFYNLLPGLTAYENVAITKDIVKNALNADEMLKVVGLTAHRNKFPAQMSGGEQQRISIARALSKNPKIILGDEPTGALDSETGVEILSLFYKMCRESGKTVILVTHNSDYAQCADKVVHMKNGTVTEVQVNPAPVPIGEVKW